MKAKFYIGEIYEIAPTEGLDVPRGQIQILGIVNATIVPDWVNIELWETGDADFDWELFSKPWYAFCTSEDVTETNYLPEWALDEVYHKARKEKIEKWRNRNYLQK